MRAKVLISCKTSLLIDSRTSLAIVGLPTWSPLGCRLLEGLNDVVADGGRHERRKKGRKKGRRKWRRKWRRAAVGISISYARHFVVDVAGRVERRLISMLALVLFLNHCRYL